MTLTTTPFDVADYLETDEDIAHYLDAAMEGGDAEHFRNALNNVARARGIVEATSDAPRLDELTTLLDRIGLKLRVERLAA